MGENIFEINNLSVDYLPTDKKGGKPFRAVSNVSLQIRAGEVFAIAGESGCGKSTLAKTMIRLLKPAQGEVYFEGKDINKLNSAERKNFTSSVQMVFQNPYHSVPLTLCGV